MPECWDQIKHLALSSSIGLLAPIELNAEVELDHIEHPPEVEAKNDRLGREYFERVGLAARESLRAEKENTRRLDENCTSAEVEYKRLNETTTSGANGKEPKSSVHAIIEHRLAVGSHPTRRRRARASSSSCRPERSRCGAVPELHHAGVQSLHRSSAKPLSPPSFLPLTAAKKQTRGPR